MKKTRIIFVGNYKGGVGKTTTVLNLAHLFSDGGKDVLVIDIDPQSSLSEIISSNNIDGVPLRRLCDRETLNYLFDLYIKKISKYPTLDLNFNTSIVKKYRDKFYYVPSSLFYMNDRGLDSICLDMSDGIDYLSIFKKIVDNINLDNKYDIIIIDCPPSNNLITQSAFLMSDFYIIPTIMDRVSSNGVVHYIKTIDNIYKKYCEEDNDAILYRNIFQNKPELMGIFYTLKRGQVNYAIAKAEFEKSVKEYFKDENNALTNKILKTEINNYIDIARSTETGMPTPKNDYQELFAEMKQKYDWI